jgi:APA family basic amino acid/polyamine antiporter
LKSNKLNKPVGNHSEPQLRRELNLLDSTMINVGTTLASAIFIVPAIIVSHVNTFSTSMLVWLVAGVLSLFGALTFAELGVMFPKAGGEFIYLKEAYSPVWGYLYGWTLFSVIQCGSIAAVSVAMATYIGYFIPLGSTAIKIIAIATIIFLSWINCISLRLGAGTQNLFTFIKIAIVLGIIACCFLLGGEVDHSHLSHKISTFSLGAFGLGMVAALWAFDGWISITFVGSEVKNPGRNFPLSLIFSMIIIIVLYLGANAAYFYVLPTDKLAASPIVAADAMKSILGNLGGSLTSLAVIISMFGAVNGFILTGARVYYAMAADGLFFKSAAKISAKHFTPINAIIIQAVWSAILTLSGTYEQLFTYVIFDSWMFYAMGGIAVILFRYTKPTEPRPYKTWRYPIIPLIFIVMAIWFLVNTLFKDPRDSLIGIGIMLLGLPFYFYWRSRKRIKSL